MSSMNNLDLIIKQASASDQQYEEFKALVNRHLNGDLRSDELPEALKQAIFNWEIDEMELESYSIQPWEDYDGE